MMSIKDQLVWWTNGPLFIPSNPTKFWKELHKWTVSDSEQDDSPKIGTG